MVGAVNPYLSFNGNCEEAFNFYRSVFGGEFECVAVHGSFWNQLGIELHETSGWKIKYTQTRID